MACSGGRHRELALSLAAWDPWHIDTCLPLDGELRAARQLSPAQLADMHGAGGMDVSDRRESGLAAPGTDGARRLDRRTPTA